MSRPPDTYTEQPVEDEENEEDNYVSQYVYCLENLAKCIWCKGVFKYPSGREVIVEPGNA